ncbi:F-box domain-containing protein [Phlyctema vagabunda]|uniref:F-box domain-containing protein n=1 Tax=Phlyctema vagabunda TaxID=108571 RepID=A0ABR4PGV6_9HELO
MTCKSLQYLIMDDRISSIIIRSKAAHSLEATTSKNLKQKAAAALRRIAKRRDAIANTEPFYVAIIGVADVFLYLKGVLCYIIGNNIRVLNLHNSSHHETVIDIPQLLQHTPTNLNDNAKGSFQILYYSDDIISCCYKSAGFDETPWLVAFDISKRIVLIVKELSSTDKLFARHNSEFLYFGTHSEMGMDGHKKWVFQGYQFATKKWFENKVHVPELVGSEIGQTVCFEFHEGYFYALSNQTSFEVEEIDWTSFYHCVRFPLCSPCKDLVEYSEQEEMWRRQHLEGPIDDRWTSLQLDIDEASGELRIVESRTEWQQGSSKRQRTCYTTEIVFPETDSTGDTRSFDSTHEIPSSASNSSSSSESSSSSSSDKTCSTATDCDLTSFPDVQVTRLIDKFDNPHHLPSRPRLACFTHPGDIASELPTLSNVPFRTYDSTSNTFLDLITEAELTDGLFKQNLRLRSLSRKLGPVPRDAGDLVRPSDEVACSTKERYRESEVQFWPDPKRLKSPGPSLKDLQELLNPQNASLVEGTADERSLVYSVGFKNAPQALIFVSFDPAIKLKGLQSWWGVKGIGEGPHIDGRATGGRVSGIREELVPNREEEQESTEKGKGKEMGGPIIPCGSISHDITSTSLVDSVGCHCWVSIEKAMYCDINRNYWLGA